jgi:hypothetical protein
MRIRIERKTSTAVHPRTVHIDKKGNNLNNIFACYLLRRLWDRELLRLNPRWLNSRPTSQTTVCNHHNVFTLTLHLSEGRTVEAWEPSNKIMSFLHPQQRDIILCNFHARNSRMFSPKRGHPIPRAGNLTERKIQPVRDLRCAILVIIIRCKYIPVIL